MTTVGPLSVQCNADSSKGPSCHLNGCQNITCKLLFTKENYLFSEAMKSCFSTERVASWSWTTQDVLLSNGYHLHICWADRLRRFLSGSHRATDVPYKYSTILNGFATNTNCYIMILLYHPKEILCDSSFTRMETGYYGNKWVEWTWSYDWYSCCGVLLRFADHVWENLYYRLKGYLALSLSILV